MIQGGVGEGGRLNPDHVPRFSFRPLGVVPVDRPVGYITIVIRTQSELVYLKVEGTSEGPLGSVWSCGVTPGKVRDT